MAISKIKSEDESVDLTINNGDLLALRQIYKDWGFKDEESVLRYALAVLTKATNCTLYYLDDLGEKVGLQPSDAVKKPADQSAPTGG
jgi:hypothetical protein